MVLEVAPHENPNEPFTKDGVLYDSDGVPLHVVARGADLPSWLDDDE